MLVTSETHSGDSWRYFLSLEDSTKKTLWNNGGGCQESFEGIHHDLFVSRYPSSCVTTSFLILDSSRWKGCYIGKYTSRTEGKGFSGACYSNRWKGILENTPGLYHYLYATLHSNINDIYISTKLHMLMTISILLVLQYS